MVGMTERRRLGAGTICTDMISTPRGFRPQLYNEEDCVVYRPATLANDASRSLSEDNSTVLLSAFRLPSYAGGLLRAW